MSYRILLVDDDTEHLDVNKRVLTKAGYSVVTAQSGEDAVDVVRKARSDFAVILMDHHMPTGINGPQATLEIKKLVPSQQILSFSMDDAKSVMRENFKAGVIDCLYKNSDNATLLKEVANACAKFELSCRTISMGNLGKTEKSEFIRETHMIGQSDTTLELCQQIRKVAPTDATVLILGETGTGKEVAAQALHKCSNRRNKPFIGFNVAAEADTLIDSSLFGHRKGSFTGATQDKLGKFQLAHGGTIFLDEIGDLNLDLQVKLLRVIQEREIIPVGAVRPIQVDVRIIAATHKNLLEMVKTGSFREDLYYRLKIVVLETKPLRDRVDDIEPLLAFFTEKICEANRFRKRFNRECLEVFKKHKWPSNVRGLQSIVESHLIMSDAVEIKKSDLDKELFEEYTEHLPSTMDEIDHHVEQIKRGHLSRILSRSKTHADAARALNVAPNRLHYFLTKFGLGNSR